MVQVDSSGNVFFGKCKRCRRNPARFMPTQLCTQCHHEFSRIPAIEEIGYEERKQRVNRFFSGEKVS